MARSRVIFVCQECGARSPRWVGRCPECGEWNALVEEPVEPGPRVAPARAGVAPQPITAVPSTRDIRIRTHVDEFDRILGGGVVLGSAVLIGGEPGIGKSTLLLQAADRLAREGAAVLYVTTEESVEQTRLRAERLRVGSDRLLVAAETDLDLILALIDGAAPALAIVDSVQMVHSADLPSAPGSVGQLRQCAARLVATAKQRNIPVFLVGHVTKEGLIAGPRALEHMVDTVLYFEGDRFRSYRLLRAVKNRFGPTDEIAVFDMRREGLVEVANPSELFLSDHRTPTPGSVVVACVEGSRAILVEVQALTTRAHYGMPERKVTGVDYNRVCMLLAVLQRRVGLGLEGHDVFVNVVGGVRIDEPPADLAVALAVASSFHNVPVPIDSVLIGEVGLGGEVRGVTHIGARLREAARVGFKRAVIPEANAGPHEGCDALELAPVAFLSDAIDQIARDANPPETDPGTG